VVKLLISTKPKKNTHKNIKQKHKQIRAVTITT